MAAASRFIAQKVNSYFGLKQSKAERYGLNKGVPFVDQPQSGTHAQSSHEPKHPEDKHLFESGAHGPLPSLGVPDELGKLPVIPSKVLKSGRLDSLIPIDMMPGVREIKSLLKRVGGLVDQDGDESELVAFVCELEADYKSLLERIEELNPTSNQLGEALMKLRQELMNTLVHLENRTKKGGGIRMMHRQAILRRALRCEEAYKRVLREFQLIQGSETLQVARQIQSQQNSHTAALKQELQATEEEIQRILRRETGNNVSRELILQERIRFRELPAVCTSRRFSIYKGEMVSGDKIAIKFSEVQSNVDDDEGRNFGRRILRHASTWASFDSKYILPFLGMGVEIIERKEEGKRDCYKVYFVSPWIPNGNAVNYIRETHEQRLHVDIAKIVRDIALGLQYLHQRDEPCIHGSVRGENVLIKTDNGVEQACLNGFALTKRQVRTDPPVEMTGEDKIHRWKAPEILDCPGLNPRMEPPSDIWSWAMTALELYSGKEPYYQYVKDPKIINDITSGKIPTRDQYPDFEEYAPQPGATWALFEKCWKMDPEERPVIQEVLDELDRIEAMPKAGSN